MNLERLPPIVKFAIVGALGYIVDATVLSNLIGPIGPVPARLLSFLTAASVTFALNRSFTFAASGRDGILRQYVTFLAANMVGGAVNIASSTAIILSHHPVLSRPFIAVGIGAALGFVLNYALSSRLVFARDAAGVMLKRGSP